MQRKTNLFYVKGQDSNFLTFSNFTEALTGNFLSTDWKIYPSRFLCLYIPKLEQDKEVNKEDLIKNYLVAYYENKLAFLRDYYAMQNAASVEDYDLEGDIDSLAWLIETIQKFDPTTEINFIGEVTEFDYKGSYTDAICIIDASEGYYDESEIDLEDVDINEATQEESTENKLIKYIPTITSENVITYDASDEILYNWTLEELQHYSKDENDVVVEDGPYTHVTPVFDSEENNEYNIGSTLKLTKTVSNNTSLKFNVIIPLFDITDMYAGTNSTIIDENTDEFNEQDNLIPNEAKSINNPMGIWFADELIELNRDKESKYAPSWSLTISSQFKPLPYSNQYLNNDITQKDNEQAFQTYAQVLAQQMMLSQELANLSTRIAKIEQVVAKLNDLSNKELIQGLNDFKNLKETVEEKIDSIQSKVDSAVAIAMQNYEYKWK